MLKINKNNNYKNFNQMLLQIRIAKIPSIPSKKGNTSIDTSLISYQVALALKATALVNIRFTGKAEQVNFLQNKITEIIENDKTRAIPVIQKINSDFIKEIIDKISENPDKPILIGITGASASGKSTITKIITDKINSVLQESTKNDQMLPVAVISGDNYYHEISEEVTKVGGIMNFLAEEDNDLNSPKDVNIKRMNEDLMSLKEGNETNLPTYSFKTFESNFEGLKQKPARCIISEGIFALHDTVKDVHDVKIFIDAPEDIITARWYERAPGRGFKEKKSQDNVFNKVNTRKKEYIEPTKEFADIVINGHSKQEDIESVTNEICNAIQQRMKNRKE